MFCLFIYCYEVVVPSSDDDMMKIKSYLYRQGVTKILLQERAEHSLDSPHRNENDGPRYIFQIYSDDISVLESISNALWIDNFGNIDIDFPILYGFRLEQQIMAVRNVLSRELSDKSQSFVSYLVHYPGAPECPLEWHAHYIQTHSKIMIKFPRIIHVEIFTPVFWIHQKKMKTVKYFQRNSIGFETLQDLHDALRSPVITDMLRDSSNFPLFFGGSSHYPMYSHEFLISG